MLFYLNLNYMNTEKQSVPRNALIISQLSYCPLFLFHGRAMNNIMNKIQEKTVRYVYKNENNLI